MLWHPAYIGASKFACALDMQGVPTHVCKVCAEIILTTLSIFFKVCPLLIAGILAADRREDICMDIKRTDSVEVHLVAGGEIGVGAGEGVECASADPPRTQLLGRNAKEAADVCTCRQQSSWPSARYKT